MGITVAHHPVRIFADIVRAGRDTPSGLESRQRERLRRLVAFAREHSVFYGKLYAGLPSVIRDPHILPPVSKRDLMANFDGWATDDAVRRETAEAFVADPSRIGRYYLDRYLAFATSGTTGRPAVFLHDRDAVNVYLALMLARRLPTLIASGSKDSFLGNRGRTATIITTGGHFTSSAGGTGGSAATGTSSSTSPTSPRRRVPSSSGLGASLMGASGKAGRWRDVVEGVRSRFSGTLTYAANWGGEEVGLTWWDAVDLIGVDAYYPLTDGNDPTVQELEDAWATTVQTLADLTAAWDDMPVIFTEVGYRSVDGTNQHPWDWVEDYALDLQEQADCYEAVFGVFWDESWFGGLYIWDWSPDPTVGGPTDKDFTPYGKPAEDVLRTWFA